MDYDKLAEYFSDERLNKYLIASGENKEKSAKIYEANIRLSKSFHPLISILEVSLRNGINDNLCNYFGSNNWILEQKVGFMVHPDLTYRDSVSRKDIPNNFFIDKVKEVENKFLSKNINITHNKLLAELSFGFWTKFFDAKPVKIIKGKQLQAFRSGTRLKAEEVYDILNSIRLFRNRISHHEPICFNDYGDFCLKKSLIIYHKIREVLRWLGNDVRDWSDKFDNVIDELNTAIKI